jgi:hypothetical protein
MFCSECGEQVADNNKFCGECGAAQINTTVEQIAETVSRNNSQASLSNKSTSDFSNVAGYIVGTIMLIGLSYGINSYFSLKKTEITVIEDSNKIDNLSAQSEGESKSTSAPKNNLEAAIDPVSGSSELWDMFVDNGGLNGISNYYGMQVQGINVQWHQGKVKIALMNVSKSVAPVTVRSALSKGCGVQDSDWSIETGSLIKGNARNGKIECSYLTNDSARNYDVVIQVDD